MSQRDAKHRHKRDDKKSVGRRVLSALLKPVKRLGSKETQARQVSRQSTSLIHLNDHQLKDIGLTRHQPNSGLGRGIFDISSQRYYIIRFRIGGLDDPVRPDIGHSPKDD